MSVQMAVLYTFLQFLGYLAQMIPMVFLFYASYRQEHLRFSKKWLLPLLNAALVVAAATGAIYLGTLFAQGVSQGDLLLRGNLIFAACFAAGTLIYFLGFKKGVRGRLLIYMMVVQYGILIYVVNKIIAKFVELPFLPPMCPYSLRTLLTYLVVLGVSFPCFYLFLRYGDVQELLRISWSGLKMITICSFMILTLMTLALQMEMRLTLDGVTKAGKIYVSVWMLCLMASDILAYFIYFRSLTLQKEKQEIQSRLISYQQQYKWLNERIEKEKKRRHNLRHHLRTMSMLAQEGMTEKLQNYIENYLSEIKEIGLQNVSSNPALDEVMSYYIVQAQEKKIDIRCRIDVSEKLLLNLTDMTVLLGNALENAMNTCERCPEGDARIRVIIRQFKKNLLIKVENSIAPEEYDVLGRKVRMGYGLESIDMIVRKYQGDMDLVREKDKFVLKVILNVSEEEER